jgi:hypothetical protein
VSAAGEILPGALAGHALYFVAASTFTEEAMRRLLI